MKPKASEKAVAAAREQARELKNKASQAGRAAQAAKDEFRQAKSRLKLAKQESKQARKASRDAKRQYAEATRAAQEAAAEVAALEKQTPVTRGKVPPTRAASGKSSQAPAGKRVSTRPKSRAAAPGSIMMNPPAGKEVSSMPVSAPCVMPVQPETAAREHTIEVPGEIFAVSSDVVPGDIAPVPAEVFAGGPSQYDDDFALLAGDTGR